MSNNSNLSQEELVAIERKATADAREMIQKIDTLATRQAELQSKIKELQKTINTNKAQDENVSVKGGFREWWKTGQTKKERQIEHIQNSKVRSDATQATHAEVTKELNTVVQELAGLVDKIIKLTVNGVQYTKAISKALDTAMFEGYRDTTGQLHKLKSDTIAKMREIKDSINVELKKQQAAQEQYDNVDQRLAEKENIDKQQTKDIAFLKEAAKQKIETDEQQNKEIEFLKRAATYNVEVDQKQEKHIETLKIAADQNIETDRQQSQAISALEQEANENLQRDKELATRFENTEQTILSKAKAANIISIIALVIALATAVKTFLLN